MGPDSFGGGAPVAHKRCVSHAQRSVVSCRNCAANRAFCLSRFRRSCNSFSAHSRRRHFCQSPFLFKFDPGSMVRPAPVNVPLRIALPSSFQQFKLKVGICALF